MVLLVLDVPLFWDNVLLGGKLPTWYFNHGGLANLYPPEEIAGYPPLFGLYISQMWLWFGRSLTVTHLAMLPFLWGISLQVIFLVRRFMARRVLVMASIVMLCLPVLLSLQCQCGPDIVFIFIYLFCLNKILDRQRLLLLFGLCILPLISPRAGISLFSLFIIDQILLGHRVFAFRWPWAFGKGLTFLPAAILLVAWYWGQNYTYGWWVTNPHGAWAGMAKGVGPITYVYNLFIAGYRMVDFGQMAVFISLIVVVVGLFRRQRKPHEFRPALIVLFLVPAVVFGLTFSLFQNPIGHRYMVIPVLFALLWLLFEWSEFYSYKVFFVRCSVFFCIFMLGQVMISLYPKSVAKGWDGSLAHIAAGRGRWSVVEFAHRRQIPLHSIGATYPNLDAVDASFLNGDTSRFAELNLVDNSYVLITNASNDYPNMLERYLEEKGTEVFSTEIWPVYYKVYRLPTE